MPSLNPDARLLALGRELEAAWEIEKAGFRREASDEEVNLFCDRTGEIVDRIEQIPATTIRGFQVKARAISWSHAGEPIKSISGEREPCKDDLLACSLIRDLLSLH